MASNSRKAANPKRIRVRSEKKVGQDLSPKPNVTSGKGVVDTLDTLEDTLFDLASRGVVEQHSPVVKDMLDLLEDSPEPLLPGSNPQLAFPLHAKDIIPPKRIRPLYTDKPKKPPVKPSRFRDMEDLLKKYKDGLRKRNIDKDVLYIIGRRVNEILSALKCIESLERSL